MSMRYSSEDVVRPRNDALPLIDPAGDRGVRNPELLRAAESYGIHLETDARTRINAMTHNLTECQYSSSYDGLSHQS
jgi:hypothetical protein